MSNTSLSISAIPQYQKSHLRPFFIAVASLGSQCPITFSSIFQQTNFAQFKHLITCSFQKTGFLRSVYLSLMAFANKSLQKRAISAPNIFLLKIMVYDGTKVLRVDCPKIRTIRVSTINYLKVNGVLFQEISFVGVGLQLKCGRNVIGLTLA